MFDWKLASGDDGGLEVWDVVGVEGRTWASGRGALYSSTDGERWEKSPMRATKQNFVSMAAGDGRLVALGHKGSLAISEDGGRFSALKAPVYEPARVIAWGDRVHVIPGSLNSDGDDLSWRSTDGGRSGTLEHGWGEVGRVVGLGDGRLLAASRTAAGTSLVVSNEEGRFVDAEWRATPFEVNRILGPITAVGDRLFSVDLRERFDLVRSEDGGRSWRVVLSMPAPCEWRVAGHGETVVLVVEKPGRKPHVDHTLRVCLSEDGGSTFDAMQDFDPAQVAKANPWRNPFGKPVAVMGTPGALCLCPSSGRLFLGANRFLLVGSP